MSKKGKHLQGENLFDISLAIIWDNILVFQLMIKMDVFACHSYLESFQLTYIGNSKIHQWLVPVLCSILKILWSDIIVKKSYFINASGQSLSCSYYAHSYLKIVFIPPEIVMEPLQ